MDISAFLQETQNKISNQDTPNSITPEDVGGQINELAELTKTAVDLVDEKATATELALAQEIEHRTLDVEELNNRVDGLDQFAIGLGNVDNTSDLDKPVSIAQQFVLSLKADKEFVDIQDVFLSQKIDNETARAIGIENTKASISSIHSPATVVFTELVANKYTNVVFAGQSVTILYKNPTTLDRAEATFDTNGVLTLPFTAVAGFTATLIGATGAMGAYIKKADFDKLNLDVIGGVVPFGTTDALNTFTTNFANTTFRSNKQVVEFDSYLNKINVYITRPGNQLRFYVLSPTGDGRFYFSSSITILKDHIVGLSQFIAGVDYPITLIKKGQIIIHQAASNIASLGFKNTTAGGYSFTGTGTVATPVTPSLVSSEIGFNFEISVIGVHGAISEINKELDSETEPIIRFSDLTLDPQPTSLDNVKNLFSSGSIANNALINSSFGYQTGATGWKVLLLPIKAGATKLFVKNIFTRIAVPNGGIWRLQTDSSVGGFFNGGEEFEINIPAGYTGGVYINLKAPTEDNDLGFANAYISYEKEPKITKILGIQLFGQGGVAPVDPISGAELIADLPVSDGANIEPGYAYIDSLTQTIKVKV